jgi:membrane dipeptidase
MTDAGAEWLEEMHRLRLVADLSHCGHRTTSDFIAGSRNRPLVISHANACEVCPGPRNRTDEHIRGIAGTGGLIDAVMWTPAARHDQHSDMDDYINHVDHLVSKPGIDHVAFASDPVESARPDPEVWEKSFGLNARQEHRRRPWRLVRVREPAQPWVAVAGGDPQRLGRSCPARLQGSGHRKDRAK